MPGQALPLVTISEEGQFSPCEETLSLLSQQPHPVAIVAVAGLYRSGKSYLLNLLTKSSSGGFVVGSSVNACTKGIWIWSEPFYDEEKNLWVYYIDTEGLGSTTRSETHDSRVFALSILLSSYFIYNSRGVIDNQALEDLSLVINLTQTIKVKSTPSVKDSQNRHENKTQSLSDHFPSFLWILRDFSLKLVDEKGKRMTSRAYLENCLLPQAGFTEEIESKNRVRNMITEYFRDRDCATLVRPAEDEEVLRHLSSYPLTNLRPEFQKQVESLLSKVSKNVKAKTVLGRTINGEMFCTLLNSYVEAINSGIAPEIHSAWARVILNQCSEARRQALQLYDTQFIVALCTLLQHKLPQGNECSKDVASHFPVDTAVILECHEKAKEKSKEHYRSKVLEPDDDAVLQHSAILKRELRERLVSFIKDNRKASGAASLTKLRDIVNSMPLSTVDSMEDSGVVNVDAAMLKSALDYFQKGLSEVDLAVSAKNYLGPQGSAAASTIINSEFMERMMKWASSVGNAFRKSENALQDELHKLELDLATASATVEAKRSVIMNQAENDNMAANALQERMDAENAKFKELASFKKHEITRYESMLSDLGLMHQRSISNLESRIQEHREKLKQERENVLEEQRKLGEGKIALKAEHRNADDARDKEKLELGENLSKQEAHIASLSAEMKELEQSHRKMLEKKSQEQFEETTTLSRKLEKEYDELVTNLKEEARRDEEDKSDQVRELEDTIRRNEQKLHELGVDPGETQSIPGDSSVKGKQRRNSKKKKQQSCQQS